MAFNYNPKDYLLDLSWIGEFGEDIGAIASKVPSLIELNREVKEDTKMKEKSQKLFADYINQFKDEDITLLYSEMTGKPISEVDAMTAKQNMIDSIPAFDENTTNEEYSLELVNKFINPMIAAGDKYNTNKNTDKFTPDKIFGSLYSTDLYDFARGTESAKVIRDRNEKLKTYERQTQISSDIRKKDEQEAHEKEQTRKLQSSKVITYLIEIAGSDVMEVYNTDYEATMEQREAAARAIIQGMNAQQITQSIYKTANKTKNLTENKDLTFQEVQDRLTKLRNYEVDMIEAVAKLESDDNKKGEQAASKALQDLRKTIEQVEAEYKASVEGNDPKKSTQDVMRKQEYLETPKGQIESIAVEYENTQRKPKDTKELSKKLKDMNYTLKVAPVEKGYSGSWGERDYKIIDKRTDEVMYDSRRGPAGYKTDKPSIPSVAREKIISQLRNRGQILNGKTFDELTPADQEKLVHNTYIGNRSKKMQTTVQ